MIAIETLKGNGFYGNSQSGASIKGLRQRRKRRPRAGRCQLFGGKGAVSCHHRAVRLRKIHVAAHSRRRGQADLRSCFSERRGRLFPHRHAACGLSPPRGRTDLSVLQSDSRSERGGEYYAARPDGRPQGQRDAPARTAAHTWSGGPRKAPAQPALRRPSAAPL